MKKYAYILAFLAVASLAYAELRPFAFPFIGRWQPSDNPVLIDDYGFQDIQNLRKVGKGLRGVGGHTAINEHPIISDGASNGFHFRKHSPAETNTLVYTANSIGHSALYNNTAAIPSAGEFASIIKRFNDDFAYFDFEGFSETDTIDDRISVDSETQVTITGVVQAEDVMLIYDHGAGSEVDGDFVRRFAVKMSGGSAYDALIVWALATTDDGPTDASTYSIFVLVSYDATYGAVFRLCQGEAGSVGVYGAINTYDYDEQYYLEVERTGTKVYLTVYDDSDYTQLVTTTSSLISNDTGDYRYEYGVAAETEIAGLGSATGVISDFQYGIVTSSQMGRFSDAPQGQMVFANGDGTYIWGGDESDPIAVFSSTAAVTDTITGPKDYTDRVTNNDTTEFMPIGEKNASECVLLMHFDGADGATTTADSSSGGTHGNATAAGDAQLDTDQKKFGTAALILDGTGDKAYYADDDDWTFAGDWTVDFWIRLSSFPNSGKYYQIVGQYEDADNYWRILVNSSGRYLFQAKESGTARPSSELIAHARTSLNTWYHVAVVRSGNDHMLFLNGELQDTETDSYTPSNLTGALEIGLSSTVGDVYCPDAWIDELRILNGDAEWDEDFSVPTEAHVTSQYFVVGTYKPIEGVKVYVNGGNTDATPTLTVKEWNGSSWTDLTITDNSSGLSATGTVTWDATDGAKVKVLEGLSLYWYQFYIDAGNSSVYRITVDNYLGEITNIWDGTEVSVASAKVYTGTKYQEYTDEANDTTPADGYTVVMDSLGTSGYLTLGFTEPQQGVHVYMRPTDGSTDYTNSTDGTISVYYWDGASWVSATGVSDGTYVDSESLGQSGTISWQAVDEWTEYPLSISGDASLYQYKLQWSAAMDATTEIYHITGIPAPQAIGGYSFPVMFGNRVFLFDEYKGKRNIAIYSAYNAPYIFNGEDAGYLYFGDDSPVTAAASIYNVFQTTGYEQLIVTKNKETWRVLGTSPVDWEVKQMSGNVGCVAPLSMAVCDISDISSDTKRHVAIWQSNSGVVMCDGATIVPISDDIRCYWDQNDSRAIPTARLDDSFGWYDPNLRAYKLLISSGAVATTHNVELEFSLRNQEWTKIYRENADGGNPLQIGFVVTDTNGMAYSYGATNEGYVYRTENGTVWDVPGGVDRAIEQYVHTKDLLLDGNNDLFNETVVEYLRLLLEKKTSASENIAVAHYCDGTATTDGSNYQDEPAAYDMSDGPIVTKDVFLGPCLYHSFMFSVDISTLADGMELNGMGLYFDTHNVIGD